MAGNREDLIFNLLKGKDTITSALTNTKKAVALLDKTISKVGGKFTGLGGQITAVFGGAALIRGALKAVETAKSFENALIGLRSVARNTGNDLKTVEEAAQSLAADGLIPLNQASNSVKTLLASGLSIDKATELLDSFKDAAAFNRQGQLELGDAIERGTQGFKNRLSINVDNVGITKNLSQIEREYTAETGKSTKSLDEKALSLVLANGLIKEASVFQGDYNKLLNTFTGASSKASTATTFLLADLGGLITSNPQVIQGLEEITSGVNAFSQAIKDNGPALSKLVGDLANILVITPSKFWLDFFTKGATAASGIGEITSEIGKFEKKVDDIQTRIEANKGKTLYNSFIGKADQDKRELSEAIDKLSELRSTLKSLQDVGAQKEQEQQITSARDDARVIREKEVNALVNQFKEEQAVLESERDAAASDASELKGEERLLAIQDQLTAENSLKELAAQQEKATAIKNDLELKKFRADASIKDIKETEKAEKAKLNLSQKTAQANVAIASGAANLIAAATKDGSKVAFVAQKAAAIAGAIVATNLAAAQALAVPPAPNVALATSAKISGGLNIAAIVATGIKGFQEGGILGGRKAGDNNLARFNGDEVFLNKPQQAELLEVARGNRSPEGGGNDALSVERSRPIVVEIDGREIARVLRDTQADGVVI